MRKATHRESLSNRASLTQGPRIEKSVESRLPHQEPRIEKAHRSRLPHARASHRKAHRIAPPLRPPSLCVRSPCVRSCAYTVGASGGVARAEGCACRRRRAPAETRLRRRGRARLAVCRRCEYARARVGARCPGRRGLAGPPVGHRIPCDGTLAGFALRTLEPQIWVDSRIDRQRPRRAMRTRAARAARTRTAPRGGVIALCAADNLVAVDCSHSHR
jgi:hypothetical protein